MCDAGLLDRHETKSGDTLFKAVVDKKTKSTKAKSENKKKTRKTENTEVKEEDKQEAESSSKTTDDEPLPRVDATQVEFYVEKTRGPVTKAAASPQKEERKDHEITILSKHDPTQVFHTRDYIRLIRYIISHMQQHGEPQAGISQIDKVIIK